MCGFVINDLSDIEKDRENHPDRPLPSRAISELNASFVYFGLLAVSLTMVKLFVEPRHIYLYVLLLIALINYNYVVAYIPAAKNLYVATVGLLPILILTSLIENNHIVPLIAPPLFLFLLSREILMDVQDAKGDGRTLVKLVGPNGAENAAFGIKFMGSFGLCLAIVNRTDAILVGLVVILDVIFLLVWKLTRYRRVVIHAMKLQLLIGIYFVIVGTPTTAAT
jgi:geranylgeranylglycerol-phosphate geranylgeranyltransferase